MSAGLGFDFSASNAPPGTDPTAGAIYHHQQQKHNDDAALLANSLSASHSQESSTMRHLRNIELGEAMIEINSSGSGIRQGQRIAPDITSPGGGTRPHRHAIPPNIQAHLFVDAPDGDLGRHGTLLSAGDTSSGRAANQLRSLLGNSHGKIRHGAVVPPSASQMTYTSSSGTPLGSIAYEQAKSRARVEVDIVLDSPVFVQGNDVQGSINIRIRKPSKSSSGVLLAGGKVRIVGFESIASYDSRHIFYHCSYPLSAVATANLQLIYASPPDSDVFCVARSGRHAIPFSFHLPVGSDCKGSVNLSSGISVQYIAVVSLQVKDADTGKRSIAHFYRQCEVWPRLNPSTVLAEAPEPITATTTQSFFMAGSGKVDLTASLHRPTGVAGQKFCVWLHIINDSKKAIKSTTLSLIRSIVVFKPQPYLDPLPLGLDYAADPDACQTITIEKQIAESSLHMGQRGTRGHASAKGWWGGVGPGEERTYCHFLQLPPDALSVSRGRYIEIKHQIRVTISGGTLSSDISVNLPIQIVNFLSLDPPPLRRASSHPAQVEHMPSIRPPLPHKPRSYPRAEALFHAEGNVVSNGSAYSGIDEEERIQAEEHSDSDSSEEQDNDWETIASTDDEHLDVNLTPRSNNLDTIEECSLHDDNADDFVQFAVSNVKLSENHQPSFSDLYYLSGTSGATSQEEPESSSEGSLQPLSQPLDRKPGSIRVGNGTLTRPTRPRGPSSFTRRVEAKMMAREQDSEKHEEDQGQDATPVPNGSQEEVLGSPYCGADEPRENPSFSLAVSKTSSSGSGYGSATTHAQERGSQILARPVECSVTGSTLSVKSARGSRVLPTPPVTVSSGEGEFEGIQMPLSTSAFMAMRASRLNGSGLPPTSGPLPVATPPLIKTAGLGVEEDIVEQLDRGSSTTGSMSRLPSSMSATEQQHTEGPAYPLPKTSPAKLPLLNSARPAIPTSSSSHKLPPVASVKDKIRELEEKFRAVNEGSPTRRC